MYSICMIHSVLILNVPMFKRRTHKLSEQMFKRCSTNRTPVFIYEHNSVHVFNFKCLMFQFEHRQGVEPVFAFNICCIAFNASLCSSLEHFLAFKMCSMQNICLCSSAAHWKCPILQNTFEVFNICCIVGVQIVFYT